MEQEVEYWKNRCFDVERRNDQFTNELLRLSSLGFRFEKLIRLEACDGIHYLRYHLIKSISHYDKQVYLGGQEPVDVKTKLNYDNTETLYFKQEVQAVVSIIMVQLDAKGEPNAQS